MNKKTPKILITKDIIESQVRYDLIDFQKKIKKPLIWPIDIECFLEKLWGLSISYEDDIILPDTNEEIVGYLSVADKEVKVNLNANKIDGRINFTLAHEAGHASLHSVLSKTASTKEIDSIIYCRSSYEEPPEIEKQANYYAVNLLMPKDIIYNKLSGLEIVDLNLLSDELMNNFGVSRYALELRLRKLGYKTKNNKYEF
jgi:Zn-dependent peptidase ImmA (M78 family)